MAYSFVRTTLSVGAVGFALLGAAMGCSSDGASSRDDFITKYCAEFAPCCAKVSRPTDGASCRVFVTALAPPSFDSSAADACLTELRAAATSPTFCDSAGSASGPSCNKVFGSAAGTAKPGEVCTKDEECAPSAAGKVICASLFNNGTEIRKCQVQVAGKAGDSPCSGTVDGNVTSFSGSGTVTDVAPMTYLCNVADGVYCDSTSMKCAAIGMVGDACSAFGGSYSCAKTAYCDSATSKCTARKAAGDACTSFSDQCSAGNYCDDTTSKCVAALAVGAACASSQACASDSCVNGKCAAAGSDDLGLAFLCGGG